MTMVMILSYSWFVDWTKIARNGLKVIFVFYSEAALSALRTASQCGDELRTGEVFLGGGAILERSINDETYRTIRMNCLY